MTDLARLLRQRTADQHEAVERSLDLPASVRSRDDYVAVLSGLLDLHAPLEQQLARPEWTQEWAAVGIDLADHRRTGQLLDDLRRLGVPSQPAGAVGPRLDGFGEALGALYVLEGSAIGGHVLAPALREAAGDVPTSFFAGEGRAAGRAWRALRAGLRRAPDELHEDAVHGAQEVFAAFGTHLASARRRDERVVSGASAPHARRSWRPSSVWPASPG